MRALYVIAPVADTALALKVGAVLVIVAVFAGSLVYASTPGSLRVFLFRDVLFDDHARSVEDLRQFISDAVDNARLIPKKDSPLVQPRPSETPEPVETFEPMRPSVEISSSWIGSRINSFILNIRRYIARASLRAYLSKNTIYASRSRTKL